MISKNEELEFNAKYNLVYRFLLSMCHNEDIAGDITQETFLKAIKSKESFSGKCSESTWLCTIAKNLYFSYCKKQGKECELDPETPASDYSIENRLSDKDDALNIHRVLHGISEPYKEVFSLRVFGQLPYSNIAEIFGKTESWAKVTYFRAKKMIIEKMREEGLL